MSSAELARQKAAIAGAGGMVNRNAKNWFFDRDLVKRSMGAGIRDAFADVGHQLRRTARGLIRPRIRPSAPYQPPHRHVSRNAYASLTNIWYAFDPFRKSLVCGPLLITTKWDPPVPQRMEKGYSASGVPNPFRRKLESGDNVPIEARDTRPRERYVDPSGRTRTRTSAGWTKETQWRSSGGSQTKRTTWVRWVRARTPGQLAAGNRVADRIWGPPTIDYTVLPRPYMRPARDKTLPFIRARMKNSLRAVA